MPRERGSGISIAEALLLLGRRGYVRAFELSATVLRCRSADTCFDPGAMVVESVTEVNGGTVLALRDTVSGTAGTWVVAEWTESERSLFTRLVRPPSATPIRRSAGAVPVRPTGGVPLDRTA